MQSKYRLKKNYQYNYVYKHAQSVADRNFVMLYCSSNSKQTKFGFSVSKKYGKAVARNRIRRQMKAAISSYAGEVSDGYNVIFLPRRQGAYNFCDVLNSTRGLLTKAGLLQ